MAPTTSCAMDFNESIFGPLYHKRSRAKDVASKHAHHLPVKSTNMTDFDESILHPLKLVNKRKKEHKVSKRCPSAAVASLDESIFGPLQHKHLHDRKGATNKADQSDKLRGNGFTGSLDSTRYNESILGPLADAKTTNSRIDRIDKVYVTKECTSGREENKLITAPDDTDTSDFDSTRYNESIFGPIVNAKAKKTSKGNPVVERHGKDSDADTSSNRNPCTFEMMMKSLEKPSGKLCNNNQIKLCNGTQTNGIISTLLGNQVGKFPAVLLL